MQYNDMSKEELLALKESLNKEYAEAKAKGLALDMTRFQEHTHMVFLVILHGASLIRLSSYVQFLDMTDILQLQKDLELR